MGIHIVKDHISRSELQVIADERFGDLIKAAIDVEQGILALGAELHADAEAELIEKENSKPKTGTLNRHNSGRISGDSFKDENPSLAGRYIPGCSFKDNNCRL